MSTLARDYTDLFIVHCVFGHSWYVMGGSQLEQQCEQYIDDGKGDLFVLESRECPLCIEERREKQDALQGILFLKGEPYRLLKSGESHCRPVCNGDCDCNKLRIIRQSRYLGQLIFDSKLLVVT